MSAANNLFDVEWAVIGGLLLDSSRLEDIDLTPEEFGNENYRQIYEAMLDLLRGGEKVIDMLTVADELHRRTRRDWLAMIGTIAQKTPSAHNVAHYAKMVREQSTKRRALEIADRLKATLASNPDAVDEAVRDLMSLNVSRRNYEYSLFQAMSKAVDYLDEIHQSGGMVGIPTGMIDLDERLGGLHDSDLVVVGARPSQGKTAFMLNLANNCGRPCGIISAEQPSEQIGMRIIALDGKVSLHRMRLAALEEDEWPRLTNAVLSAENRNMWIFDKPAPTITEVVRQARKWKHQHNIEVLFVDYLQRIKASGKKSQRREEVAEVVMAVKELARELDIPVVALAQVNREVEKRPNKRPNMSDLKEAGEIEQEADIVMTLYRDDVYNEDSPDKGVAEINVCKNRHGPTGIIRVVWDEEFMRFKSIARASYA